MANLAGGVTCLVSHNGYRSDGCSKLLGELKAGAGVDSSDHPLIEENHLALCGVPAEQSRRVKPNSLPFVLLGKGNQR